MAHGFKDDPNSPLKRKVDEQTLKKKFDSMKEVMRARFESNLASCSPDQRAQFTEEWDRYMAQLDRQYWEALRPEEERKVFSSSSDESEESEEGDTTERSESEVYTTEER
jgi:hypothetical protein